MTRLHRTGTQRGYQPLTEAVSGATGAPVTRRDHLATLTLHHHPERCDTCAWPSTCERDETCWHEETDDARWWHRTRLHLPRSVGAGRNSKAWQA